MQKLYKFCLYALSIGALWFGMTAFLVRPACESAKGTGDFALFTFLAAFIVFAAYHVGQGTFNKVS